MNGLWVLAVVVPLSNQVTNSPASSCSKLPSPYLLVIRARSPKKSEIFEKKCRWEGVDLIAKSETGAWPVRPGPEAIGLEKDQPLAGVKGSLSHDMHRVP